MENVNIALLGAGNMGKSLISGLLKNGHPASHLWVADPNAANLESLQKSYQIHITNNNLEAASQADVVILAVKPQVMKSVASDLSELFKSHTPLIISIAAGIRESAIQHWIGQHMPIVRTMPNTPALIGCGATGMHANHLVTSAQKRLAESIMRAVGITVWLEEEHSLDAVTALSGSGPAYFFHMMEALQMAAEELGLSSEVARLLTLQTAFGAARMALESGKALSELRQQVTSPGGTTEKALSVLDEHHLQELYKKALKAAKLHSEALAKQSGE